MEHGEERVARVHSAAAQAHEHLAMRTTLPRDLSREKARATQDTRLRLPALRQDKTGPPMLKEAGIKIGAVSGVRFGPGLVPCSRTELDRISRPWVAAYTQATRNMARYTGCMAPRVRAHHDRC